MDQGRAGGRRRLPHRPTLVLLPRGTAGQVRRGDARISRRREDVRSERGVREKEVTPAPAAARLAPLFLTKSALPPPPAPAPAGRARDAGGRTSPRRCRPCPCRDWHRTRRRRRAPTRSPPLTA